MGFLRNCQTGDVTYQGNFAMFTSLADISHLDDELKTNVAQHYEKLECEFRSYFPRT